MIDHVIISGFKSKHDNHPKRKTLAWGQFLALFQKPRRTTCTQVDCKHSDCPLKNGVAWSPATYPAGAARAKKLVEVVAVFVADIDHESDESVAEVRSRIGKYQHIIHASHSDRPANPNAPCTCGSEAGALHGTSCPSRVDRCLRIIFTISRPVTRDEWPRFWRAAMQYLQLPADPACCDANRLYYLPSRPADADYFFTSSEGETLDVEAILATVPDVPMGDDAAIPTMAAGLQFDEGGKVGKGERHAMLTSTAGALRSRGAGEQEILLALRNANAARCDPPKPDEELQALAKWASEQPIKPPAEADPRRPRSLTVPPPPTDSEALPNGPTEGEEEEEFIRDLKGKIINAEPENVDLALRKLGVRLKYNEFSSQDIVEGLAGYGPRLNDRGISRLRFTVKSQFGFLVTKDLFFDVVLDRAGLHRFHPVRRYLDATKWDGVKRIGDSETPSWLTTLGDAADTPYTRAVGRLVLIAAVRRVRQPGVKFDEMLILESNQGTNKSSMLRILAVDDEWFTDDLPLNNDTKHFMERTSGRWIVEAGELKGMTRADVTALKQCLSRQSDASRLSYDRKETIAPRQFIIIGTTNEKENYLRDLSGNRRFWPVRVVKFDLEELRRIRDQLWAEASVAEASGESIRLDPLLYEAAAVEQEARTHNEDPLVDGLHKHLNGVTGKIRISDAYALAGIEYGRATHDQIVRFGSAIRELGWERAKRMIGGQRCYAYVKGTNDERERELMVEIGQFGASKVIPAMASRPN